jgi:predicted dehydrogenase
MTVTVRVGFVGAGNVARRHVATLLGLGDVEVAAVADPDIERARALAAHADASRRPGPGNGTAIYDRHLDMLEREDLDALYVCVPPFAHGPPELAAVEAGLPLFVEKPIAIDLDTAERIAAAVCGRGLVTAVGYHWRNLEVVERALKLLRERPARLVVGSWLDKVPPVGWWCRRDRSGGQIVEQATHAIDLARALVGEVTQVYAAEARTERAAFPDADVNDVSAATLRFSSGAVGSLSSTCLLGWKHRASVQVFGDGLALELSEEALVVDTGSGPRAWPDRGDAKVRVDRDFIDAVKRGRNRVRVPYQEALRTHRVACALARSAEEGTPVDLTMASAHA